MKKISAGFLFLLFTFTVPANADVYVKSKMMNGMGSNETWTAGKKQRMVTSAAGMGAVMGDIINIVRADKGVEWTLNDKLKIYEEKPIALDYSKESELNEADLTKEELAELEKYRKENPETQAAPEAPACTQVDKTGPRTFAGISAHGYSSGCPTEGQKMTLWIADENQAKAKQAFKEMEDFQAARAEAMYAKYPPAKKKELMEAMKLLGTALAGGLMGMPDPSKLPQNMAMGMETSVEGQSNMMMEVTALESVPNDPSRYELPAGYTKVDSVMGAQSQMMMDNLASGEGKFSDLLKGFEQMGKEMGATAEGEAPTAEEYQQIDEGAQDVAQFVKGQQQLQGALPTNAPAEAWQQGLYDQAPAQTQQNLQQQAPQQGTVPPPQRRRPPQGNNATETLREVNTLLQNMQGLAAQFSGSGTGNIQDQLGQYGGYEDSGEYSESYSEEGNYEESYEEELPQEEEYSEEYTE